MILSRNVFPCKSIGYRTNYAISNSYLSGYKRHTQVFVSKKIYYLSCNVFVDNRSRNFRPPWMSIRHLPKPFLYRLTEFMTALFRPYLFISSVIRPLSVLWAGNPFKILWSVVVWSIVHMIYLHTLGRSMKCLTDKSMNTSMDSFAFQRERHPKILSSRFVTKSSNPWRSIFIYSSYPSKTGGFVKSISRRYNLPDFSIIFHTSMVCPTKVYVNGV